MPDRYGEPNEPVVDFDSRRQARTAAEAVEAARKATRERLRQSREVHAPLTGEQSEATRAHRANITTAAEAHRNTIRIANCGLCDDDGYRGARLCDHIDRTDTYRRGRQLVNDALNRTTPPKPHQAGPTKPGDSQ